MKRVILLSGPIGAGKTAVARELVPMLKAPLSFIEGDTFWSFIATTDGRDRRENFRILMRSMIAATVPFARSGYDVLIDFSIPPEVLGVARKIVKEIELHFVLLKPSRELCEARAAGRAEGRIVDYTPYRSFYALFEGADQYVVGGSDDPPSVLARRILDGLATGVFLVPD